MIVSVFKCGGYACLFNFTAKYEINNTFVTCM